VEAAPQGLGGRYWKVWTSSAVANLGDGVFQVAIALLAVRLTRSPALISGVALAARLPWLVLALPAGALADRLDRRRTMVRCNVARTLLLGALAAAVAFDAASIALLYVVALALGVAEVLFDTSAQTLMPAVVEKDHLSRANGRLFAAELVTNQFVGPPLGGLLVTISVALAVGSSAALYAVAASALVLLGGDYRSARSGPPSRIRTDIAEGLAYLWRHRLLRTLALLLGAQNLLSMATQSVFVLYAVSRSGLGLSDVGVGLLFTTFAIGGFLGSFVAPPLEKALGRARVLQIALFAAGIGLLVPGLFVNVAAVAASSIVSGIFVVGWNVVTVSLRQRIIPDELLGRANATYRLLGWGTMPIGAAVGGALGELLGVRGVFLIAGGATLLLLVPLLVVVTEAAIEAADRESDGAAAGTNA